MSKPRFGTILDPDFNPTRDAVHVPIIPVVATSMILPGDPLSVYKATGANGSFWAADEALAEDVDNRNYFAVADPFLNTVVEPGQLFYAWLRPESTQKLWHEWTHKELDKK